MIIRQATRGAHCRAAARWLLGIDPGADRLRRGAKRQWSSCGNVCSERFRSLAGVVVVTFLLSHALPGDPAAYFAGPAANAESIAQVRAKLGLDQSLPVQFLHYVRDLAHGNLGNSLTTGQPVLKDLIQRLPASIELTFFALYSPLASRSHSACGRPPGPIRSVDHFCRATGARRLPHSRPSSSACCWSTCSTFCSARRRSRWGGSTRSLHPAGARHRHVYDRQPFAGDWRRSAASLAQLVLPAISLGLFALAPIARITRASMLQALGSDFIRTARASGLPRAKILVTYAFRNALLPVTSVLGMVFSFLLGSQRPGRAGLRLAGRRRLCGRRGARLRLRRRCRASC